jgi:hypothetical protein
MFDTTQKSLALMSSRGLDRRDGGVAPGRRQVLVVRSAG